jgi:Protein of unknown function (DUF3168)
MSDPALAVQGAYVARLKAQVAAVSSRVYERAPQNVTFPFLQIGDIQTVEDGAECLDATEVTVTLHIWSRAVGSVEGRTLAAACRTALHEWLPDLSASGFRCVEHMHRTSRVMADPDGITSHGVLTFRLLIDPV